MLPLVVCAGMKAAMSYIADNIHNPRQPRLRGEGPSPLNEKLSINNLRKNNIGLVCDIFALFHTYVDIMSLKYQYGVDVNKKSKL